MGLLLPARTHALHACNPPPAWTAHMPALPFRSCYSTAPRLYAAALHAFCALFAHFSLRPFPRHLRWTAFCHGYCALPHHTCNPLHAAWTTTMTPHRSCTTTAHAFLIYAVRFLSVHLLRVRFTAPPANFATCCWFRVVWFFASCTAMHYHIQHRMRLVRSAGSTFHRSWLAAFNNLSAIHTACRAPLPACRLGLQV